MKTWLLSLACPVVLLSGCAVVPVEPYPLPARPPMPAPRVEFIPAAPQLGYVWVDGYWVWAGNRYNWAPGRWRAPSHWHVEPPPRHYPAPRDEWHAPHGPQQPQHPPHGRR